LQIKTKIVSCHTADSKPVKQEVNGTVILPPLVFPAQSYTDIQDKQTAFLLDKNLNYFDYMETDGPNEQWASSSSSASWLDVKDGDGGAESANATGDSSGQSLSSSEGVVSIIQSSFVLLSGSVLGRRSSSKIKMKYIFGPQVGLKSKVSKIKCS
jgi:hypothetical protein